MSGRLQKTVFATAAALLFAVPIGSAEAALASLDPPREDPWTLMHGCIMIHDGPVKVEGYFQGKGPPAYDYCTAHVDGATVPGCPVFVRSVSPEERESQFLDTPPYADDLLPVLDALDCFHIRYHDAPAPAH